MRIKLLFISVLLLNSISFLFTSCRLERYRSFFVHTEGDLYKIISDGDFDSPVLNQYTVDGTIYVLILDTGFPEVHGDDIKKNLASSKYMLFIYSKSSDIVTYRLRKMILQTSTFEEDVDKLTYYRNPEHTNETNALWASINPLYYQTSIVGGFFKYPLPKDKKISINIKVEKEVNGTVLKYDFTYYYTITYKDHWVRLLD